MKYEITYYDSRQNKNRIVTLTGDNADKVKDNFISLYNQDVYTYKSIREL